MQISETNYQSRLFPYAYNILGSVDDARDAIQDVMEKHLTGPQRELDNESAYLIRSVINHAINLKKRQNRIVESGVWLPEPLMTADTDEIVVGHEPIANDRADDSIIRQEVISYSMLVLLEYLKPKERAVFILKEAYDYSHDEIAETLSISVDNSRKLLSRAKNELNARRTMKTKPSSSATSLMLSHYIELIKTGDTTALEQMLSNDIVMKTDGGKVRIVKAITEGRKDVMALLFYVYQTYQAKFTLRITTVNFEPAILFYQGENLLNCQVFQLTDDGDRIDNMYSIVDPRKLKNLEAQMRSTVD